jgi:hypothetical protein
MTFFSCTATTTTNRITHSPTPHYKMNASHSLTATATDPSIPTDDIAYTPKAVKIFMATAIPIAVVIVIIFGLAWRRYRISRLMDIELEHLAQEVERIAQEPTYHPHPIPPPPIYIPLYPLHQTQCNRGHSHGPPSTIAMTGHTHTQNWNREADQ